MERDSTARDWNVRIMAAHIGSVTSAPYLLQWSHIETHALSRSVIVSHQIKQPREKSNQEHRYEKDVCADQ